jgi:hypothetical protein
MSTQNSRGEHLLKVIDIPNCMQICCTNFDQIFLVSARKGPTRSRSQPYSRATPAEDLFRDTKSAEDEVISHDGMEEKLRH